MGWRYGVLRKCCTGSLKQKNEYHVGSFSYVRVPPPKASLAFDFYFYISAPMSLFMDMTISWGRGFGVSKNRSVTLFKHVGCNATHISILTLLLHHTKLKDNHWFAIKAWLAKRLCFAFYPMNLLSVNDIRFGWTESWWRFFFCWYLWCICPRFFFGLSFSRIHPSEVSNSPAVISLTAVDCLAKGQLRLHWVCMISPTTWSRSKAVQMDDRWLESCFIFNMWSRYISDSKLLR